MLRASPRRRPLLAVQSGVQAAGQPEQGDQGLGVAALGDRLLQTCERPGNDLDALLLAAVAVRLVQRCGGEEVNALVCEAGAGVVDDDRLPALGATPDLLSQLALCGL